MPNTYPHQRMVKIHREPFKSDFLGIKNENWQAAARDLRPHALVLYLYLASNANNYTLALSPAAVHEAIGMPRSTYNDQIQNLISKGYLVLSHGNTYDFYEVPQPRGARNLNNTSLDYNFEDEQPTAVNDMTEVAKNTPREDIEINNSDFLINNENTNIENPSQIVVPKVKEIVIPKPSAEGKNRPKPIQKTFHTFDF